MMNNRNQNDAFYNVFERYASHALFAIASAALSLIYQVLISRKTDVENYANWVDFKSTVDLFSALMLCGINNYIISEDKENEVQVHKGLANWILVITLLLLMYVTFTGKILIGLATLSSCLFFINLSISLRSNELLYKRDRCMYWAIALLFLLFIEIGHEWYIYTYILGITISLIISKEKVKEWLKIEDVGFKQIDNTYQILKTSAPFLIANISYTAIAYFVTGGLRFWCTNTTNDVIAKMGVINTINFSVILLPINLLASVIQLDFKSEKLRGSFRYLLAYSIPVLLLLVLIVYFGAPLLISSLWGPVYVPSREMNTLMTLGVLVFICERVVMIQWQSQISKRKMTNSAIFRIAIMILLLLFPRQMELEEIFIVTLLLVSVPLVLYPNFKK